MGLTTFLKEKIISIVLLSIVNMFTVLLLYVLHTDLYAIIYLVILNICAYSIVLIYEYRKKIEYYKVLKSHLNSLDKLYMISEVIDEPNFLEGKILYNTLKKSNKSMNDEIAKYKRYNLEFREYIDMWVHEIKTPISSSKLIMENNKNEITKSINEEINRIEILVEQALFYSKSNSVEKDYIIRQLSLKKTINNVIKRNAKILIQNKVEIEIENVEYIIYSDSKWVEFIINQIFSNSIKYMNKKNKKLKIYCEDKANKIVLFIRDNGIGMNQKDISKAFEKGYTGELGRKFGESTGIGLYLCKKLCSKLSLSINIKSTKDEGTTVIIIFPKSKMNIFE
jgi:signal transduction histidine kinase